MARKVTRRRRPSKEVRLLSDEVAHVGVDVHKKQYAVCVYTEERAVVASWVQPSRAEVLMARLEPVRSQVGRVVYEAGPTGFGLVRALRDAEFGADVIAPSKTPSVPARSGKGDRRDAATLAELSAKGMLRAIRVPTLQEQADRQVTRQRNRLAKDLRRARHRIKSFLLFHGLPDVPSWSRASVDALRAVPLGDELRWTLDSLLDTHDHFLAQLKAAERKVAELAKTDRHAEEAKALCTPRGVGVITAMTFRTEVPCPERFRGGAEVASFVGLAPCVRQSGGRSRSGPILKTGNGALRRLLVEAAWRWRRWDPRAAALYRRLLASTGSANKAIVGVARHLAILLWRILVGRVQPELSSLPAPAPAS